MPKAKRAKREFCVWTAPAGQTPARMIMCFKTKKAAQKWARRERYLQVIPRNRSTVAGRRRR